MQIKHGFLGQMTAILHAKFKMKYETKTKRVEAKFKVQQIQRDRETERQRDRETERQRDREMKKQLDRDRTKERKKEEAKLKMKYFALNCISRRVLSDFNDPFLPRFVESN